jgi:purine nucleosidase
MTSLILDTDIGTDVDDVLEGALLPDLEKEQVDADTDAVTLLAASPTVLAVGPLTNVAEAVEHPAAGIEQLYLMGGDYSLENDEHNIKSDISAAAAVFASGVPVTAIGLEQTTRLRLGGAVVAEIEAAGRVARRIVDRILAAVRG